MSDGYKLIFWGIFIATFNLRFGIIIILPAFIGFIIISSGLNLIIKESHLDSFKKAKTYSDFLSILLFIGSVLLPLTGISLNQYILFQLLPVTYLAIELLLFYKIFEGTIEKQKLDKNKLFTEDYTNKLSFYIVASILNTILMCFALTLNIIWLSTVTGFIVIIIRIFLMTIMSRLKKIYMRENPESK